MIIFRYCYQNCNYGFLSIFLLRKTINYALEKSIPKNRIRGMKVAKNDYMINCDVFPKINKSQHTCVGHIQFASRFQNKRARQLQHSFPFFKTDSNATKFLFRLYLSRIQVITKGPSFNFFSALLDFFFNFLSSKGPPSILLKSPWYYPE